VLILAKYSILALIFINIIFIFSFIIGKFIYRQCESELKKSNYTVYLVFLLGFYLLLLAGSILGMLFTGMAIYAAAFTLFLIAPFIIGKFSQYKKAGLYTNIQIITLIASLLLSVHLITVMN